MDESFRKFYDNLISRTKWNLSELAGRDVGTPKTVEIICGILAKDGSLPGNATRDGLINNYLFSNVNDDMDGRNGARWDGELKRYGAQKNGVSSWQVDPSPNLRDQYKAEHRIN
jgi:hypothetical protein